MSKCQTLLWTTFLIRARTTLSLAIRLHNWHDLTFFFPQQSDYIIIWHDLTFFFPQQSDYIFCIKSLVLSQPENSCHSLSFYSSYQFHPPPMILLILFMAIYYSHLNNQTSPLSIDNLKKILTFNFSRSPELHSFLKTALQKNPKKRPTADRLLTVSALYSKVFIYCFNPCG